MLQDLFPLAKEENLLKHRKNSSNWHPRGCHWADTGTANATQTTAKHYREIGKFSWDWNMQIFHCFTHLSRHVHRHKSLLGSIFLSPFWAVKGQPNCHATTASGAGGWRRRRLPGCSTQASAETPCQRGLLRRNTPTQPTTAPSNQGNLPPAPAFAQRARLLRNIKATEG